MDLGPDPATGKRRQHYKQGFRTERETDELLSSVRSGDMVNQTATTLGQFLDDWLAG